MALGLVIGLVVGANLGVIIFSLISANKQKGKN